jgi:tRNA pseudouridine55 synthase
MNGFINLLKPPGISSNAAVVQIRRLLGVKKVGHTGTLDPGAAGVLAVCLGKATKLSDFMMNSSKEYIAEISFGRQTDTQDSYGSVTAEKACKVTLDAFAAVLPQFVGKITQITPATERPGDRREKEVRGDFFSGAAGRGSTKSLFIPCCLRKGHVYPHTL